MQKSNNLPYQQIWEYLSSLRTQTYICEVMEQIIEDSEMGIEDSDDIDLNPAEENELNRYME